MDRGRIRALAHEAQCVINLGQGQAVGAQPLQRVATGADDPQRHPATVPPALVTRTIWAIPIFGSGMKFCHATVLNAVEHLTASS